MTTFDAAHVRRSFSTAVETYDAASALQRAMAEKLLQRLDQSKPVVHRLIDIGCGTGNAFSDLAARCPNAEKMAVDLALPMLQAARKKADDWHLVCADMVSLPLETGSCDLIWSNAAFQWSSDPLSTLSECYRVLARNGLLLFSTFGPNTLNELKTAFRVADTHEHVHHFVSCAQWRQHLSAAGFVDGALERMEQVDYYTDVESLIRRLKGLGARYAGPHQRQAMMGKAAFLRMKQAYELQRRHEHIPATWELFFGCFYK